MRATWPESWPIKQLPGIQVEVAIKLLEPVGDGSISDPLYAPRLDVDEVQRIARLIVALQEALDATLALAKAHEYFTAAGVFREGVTDDDKRRIRPLVERRDEAMAALKRSTT